MGLVDTVSIPTLLKMVASGRIPAEKMGTHSFTFAQMDEAYEFSLVSRAMMATPSSSDIHRAPSDSGDLSQFLSA